MVAGYNCTHHLTRTVFKSSSSSIMGFRNDSEKVKYGKVSTFSAVLLNKSCVHMWSLYYSRVNLMQNILNGWTIKPHLVSSYEWVVTIFVMWSSWSAVWKQLTPSNTGSHVSVSQGRFPGQEFPFIWSWHVLSGFSCVSSKCQIHDCQAELQSRMCTVSICISPVMDSSVYLHFATSPHTSWDVVSVLQHLVTLDLNNWMNSVWQNKWFQKWKNIPPTAVWGRFSL